MGEREGPGLNEGGRRESGMVARRGLVGEREGVRIRERLSKIGGGGERGSVGGGGGGGERGSVGGGGGGESVRDSECGKGKGVYRCGERGRLGG